MDRRTRPLSDNIPSDAGKAFRFTILLNAIAIALLVFTTIVTYADVEGFLLNMAQFVHELFFIPTLILIIFSLFLAVFQRFRKAVSIISITLLVVLIVVTAAIIFV